MPLEIHFTSVDIGRVSFAHTPDPMWETVLAFQKLISTSRIPIYSTWRRRAIREVQQVVPKPAWAMLCAIARPASYFPDFLTPPDPVEKISEGLDHLRHTPRWRLAHDLSRLARTGPLPSWCNDIIAGDRVGIDRLTEAISLVHEAIVTPHWTTIEGHIHADRTARSDAGLADGADGLLRSLRPALHWDPPVLRGRYPVDKKVLLNGRGLRLIPSYFCWGNPVTFADSSFSPTVVYPVSHSSDWVPKVTRCNRKAALVALLGRNRARVLASLLTAATTGELSERLEISLASASEHATILREAGLVNSTRAGSSRIHGLTPLGMAVLRGEHG